VNFVDAFWLRRSIAKHTAKAIEAQEAASHQAALARRWMAEGNHPYAVQCQTLAASEARHAAACVTFIHDAQERLAQ
jgi:hypothetical protein